MYIQDVKEVEEVNSTYILGTLKDKFVAFAENIDSMGIKIDGVEIDLGNKQDAHDDEESNLDVAVPDKEELKHIPAVWVLTSDNPTNPIFRPIKTDATGTDYDKAVELYGVDIICLHTDYMKIVKTVTIRMAFLGIVREFSFNGTLKDIQKNILENVDILECRQQLLDRLEESFLEGETVDSFAMLIPQHRQYVVLGIK